MRLAIFGASGGTGRLLTQNCLDAGHEVTAVVRKPEKFALKGCRIVQGDARDARIVEQAIMGQDAVFSCLGAKSPFDKSDLLGRVATLIVSAMEKHGVKRLVVLGAGGWQPGALRKQSSLRRWLLNLLLRILKQPMASQKAQEAAIVPSSLDWTILAPPRLVNTAPRGVYRTDSEGFPPQASRIARADVAKAMFQQLECRDWIGKHLFLAW